MLSENFIRNVTECSACNLRTELVTPVPPGGNLEGDIMFIGRSPDERDNEEGIPFFQETATGDIVQKACAEAGIDFRSECFITFIAKCTGKTKPSLLNRRICFEKWGIKEIRISNPKIVILLGKDVWEIVMPDKKDFIHGKLYKKKLINDLGVIQHINVGFLYHPRHWLTNGGMGYVKDNVSPVLERWKGKLNG